MELNESEGIVVEQVIRPTGLLDPQIEVRPTDFPVDDLMDEIQKGRWERRANTGDDADKANGGRTDGISA